MTKKDQIQRYDLVDVPRNRGYRFKGRNFRSGSFGGNYYENRIKNVIIQNTGSYDGVGERMIRVIKEIAAILSGCKHEEVESVYNKIEELIVEFVSTNPYGTGMFAGITTLMSTSLMNGCPLLMGSNLTTRIIDRSIDRFLSELSHSNYYSSQLLLNFLTELTNFYVLSLNQLISLYRSLLNTCLTLKNSKKDSNSKYGVSDHNSMILFSMLAYTIPYLRDEHRKTGDNCENELYGELIKDMIQFYDSYISEYCKDVHILLQNMFNIKFIEIELPVNSFEKYWKKFLEWRDHDSPKISTVIRFYRSATISDYLSEITSFHEFDFDKKLDKVVFGKVSEYLTKLLIRIPYLETMEIGDFLLLHVMDGIIEIFMQYPFEAARQLLKIPVTSSSYDLCLSITIWNSLLNPFYSYNITYINSLVVNLIKLQSSVLNDIWIPIFINKLVNCKDTDYNINSVSHDNSMTDSNETNQNPKSQIQNEVPAEIEQSGKPNLENTCGIESKDECKVSKVMKNKEEVKKVFNCRIFPRIESYSPLMIVKLRVHFSTVFSSQELFQNPSQKSNFWRNKDNSFFYKIDEQSSFTIGFLDSVLSGMSKIMLPQTLYSIPNEVLYERINKFPSINKSIRSIPDSIHTLDELKNLNDILVFKFTNRTEVNEKNNSVIKYLVSIIEKQNRQVNNQTRDDDDIEMSRRFVERSDSNIERKQENSSELSCMETQDQKTDGTIENSNKNTNDLSRSEQDSDKNQVNDFKSQKKRRLNPSILASPSSFTWKKDALMDLLLISIIEFGAKSLTHTRRLFGNYIHSLKNWYSSTINSQVLSNEDFGNYLDTTGHPLFDAVSSVVSKILEKKLFVDSINYVFSEYLDENEDRNVVEINNVAIHLDRYTEIRLLSCILTLWGGFGIEDNNISTGYNIQKMRIVLVSIIEESVVSSYTVVLYLGCVLLSLSDFLIVTNSSRSKYMYQLFMDLFELILDVLTRISVKISMNEDEISVDGAKDCDMDMNADNSVEMNDKNNDDNELSQKSFKNKLIFSRTIIMLLVIFTSECKTLTDVTNIENEHVDSIYIKLLNSAAYDICLMYGTYIKDLVHSNMIFNGKSLLESETTLPSTLENLKSIYSFSLDSLLNASDTNKRLDNKWVIKKKDDLRRVHGNTEVKNNDDGSEDNDKNENNDLELQVENVVQP
ncbi:hypothetical protein RS030_81230 [Cryptosporidium xiaoi]|uniref:Uncharacterized protein n=1 Tax=Cryptosporidium xiaoi TaxID=659607 RepID=A0AAV9XU17_9CRYT